MLDNNVTAELFHVKPIRLSFYSKYLQSWNLFSHFYLFAGLFILTWSAVEQLYAIKYLQNYVDGKMQPSVYSFPLRHYKLSFDANST